MAESLIACVDRASRSTLTTAAAAIDALDRKLVDKQVLMVCVHTKHSAAVLAAGLCRHIHLASFCLLAATQAARQSAFTKC